MNRIAKAILFGLVATVIPFTAVAPADAARVNAAVKVVDVSYAPIGKPNPRHPEVTGILTVELSNGTWARYLSRDCKRFDRVCRSAWRMYDKDRRQA